MEQLPDEIVVDILDYLEHADVVSAQLVSPRLLKLARDNSLWRYKCFEKAPSATKAGSQPHALAALTGALGGLSLSEPQSNVHQGHTNHGTGPRISRRAQAVADWDCSSQNETINWYSEYIARNAPIQKKWHAENKPGMLEVRGVATFSDHRRAIGPLEDGSLAIWDIGSSEGPARAFRELSRAAPGILSGGQVVHDSSFGNRSTLDVTECIHVRSLCNKAYIASANILNEVDLETLVVISQQRYEWQITALSQESPIENPISVGTTWSLNLYDPRVPLRDRSRSPDDLIRTMPDAPERSIAYMPEFGKGPTSRQSLAPPLPATFSQATLSQSVINPRVEQPRLSRRRELSEFARIEPGPLSVLHQGEHDIIIAGRFPSILSYDRRFFPRLQQVIHSGARLSSITSIPHPPVRVSGTEATSTLVACGEYGGRGSLELYSWPQIKRERTGGNHDRSSDSMRVPTAEALHEDSMDSATFVDAEAPFTYKNRQEASSAKLLSVATQGTRIVFSDAEGGLKWVERDGRGLARRWNINSYEMNPFGAQVHGEQVIRKIIPLESASSDRGLRGDGDLLVWTGEQLGIVSTRTSRPEDELAEVFDEKLTLHEDKEDEAEEYAKTMRRALERQADERRWMTRFRLRSSGTR